MSSVPQPAEDLSLRIQELAGNLKIRDVMTRKVFAVTRSCTMRDVQTIMKSNAISGVPVIDNQHVVGLVSVHDIMNSYEQDWMQDSVADHMVTAVHTLIDEQPLSFAMSAFIKFPYRRFPIVDRQNQLVGMLTMRNINNALIRVLSNQLSAMETEQGQVSPLSSSESCVFYRIYRLARYDFESGGKASAELREQLRARGVDPKVIRRAAVACYELEINIIAHSYGGTLALYIDNNRVRITANDFGPGIVDVDQAMTEGYSTANDWIRSQGFGAGMGLPNTKRLSDEFVIQSGVDMGTMIKSIVNLNTEEESVNESE